MLQLFGTFLSLPACPSHKIVPIGLRTAVGDWDPLLYNKSTSWLSFPPLRYEIYIYSYTLERNHEPRFVFSIVFGNAAASYFESIDIDNTTEVDNAGDHRLEAFLRQT